MTDALAVDLPMQAATIREFLPQRYPFLLVDRVTDIQIGHSITGIKNVTINEEFFQGHFPMHPIMPGVLILEAMAQIAGVLGFVTAGKRPSDGYMYLFAGADKLRFKRQVIPGDTLTLYAEMGAGRQGIYKFSCRAHVGDELAASVDILVAEQRMELASV